jgi:acyl-coenzyme A synthetase/AMP-(fatty) acid ligase
LHDQGLVKVVKEQAKVLKIKKGSRVAWCLSPSFDASLSDIYSTLLSGACLCVYESDLTKIKTLLKFLNEGRVSHADLPPSLLSLIKPEDLPELKVVLFGGELANELAIKEWAEIKEIWNAYGPTEASICCAMRRVSDDWVCNEVGPLLPGFIGIIGEGGDLWLAGEMLCIKYHQEELNESKFIFLDGVRYYKTGDLFQKIDGSWFYLGRKDRQFKWNGVLISPEEVESAARKAGCVQANCYHGDKITLDYVGDLSPDILREKIRDFLPSNMIPHEIRREQLKLKSNGKSDL